MDRLELRIVFDLSFEIHLPKHIQGRLFATITQTRASLGFQCPSQVPPASPSSKPKGLTVVAGRNDFIFPAPDEAHEREELRRNGNDGLGWQFRPARVDNGNAAIVGCEGEGISAGREANGMHPARGII
jgi:hypothetical protein